MFRDLNGQTVDVFAFDYSTGAPKTGDAANITLYLQKDDGTLTALTDTSAAEISSSNAPGWYKCDVTQAESNGDKLLFTGKSVTANVSVVCGPARYTKPPNFGKLRILSDGSVTDWLSLAPPPLFTYPYASAPSKTIYVDPAAVGANDGTTPEDAYTTTAAAIADINALNRTTFYGVLIRHSGTESIGTSTIRFPVRTVVQCSYTSASVYTGAGPGTTPCMVSADDDCWIYGGLTITSTTGNAIRLPIGYIGTQAASRRVLIEDVTTNNMSDGAYFGNPSGAIANGHWQFHKCTFNSNWDSATIGSTNATHVLDLIDCTIIAVGPPVGSTSDVRPVTAIGGLVRCWNCTISGTGAASSGKLTYAVKTRNAGNVVLIGGTATGTDYDFGTEDASRIIKISTIHSGDTESGAHVTDLSPETADASGPIEHTPIAPSRILHVKDRGNGVFGVNGDVQIRPGETLWYALELKGSQLSTGDLIDAVAAPNPTGADSVYLTIPDYGVFGTLVKFKCVLSASATTSSVIAIEFTITPSSGETLLVEVDVNVGS